MPALRFASLGSGSKGNATIVQSAEACIMVDCGFSVTETRKRLEQLEISPESIDAILVTHEHGDHIKGAIPFAKKFGCAVYMTAGTSHKLKVADRRLVDQVDCDARFAIKDLQVQAVPVPHDAREPCQYVFSAANKQLGILTDLGSLSAHVVASYKSLDGLLLEANHCPDLLARGPYPHSLKLRVSGNWGHLSNHQTMRMLEELDESRLQHLVLGHISETNNCVNLLKQMVEALPKKFRQVSYAAQEFGFDWVDIA